MYHCGTVRSLYNIKSHDHYDLKIHLRPHDIFNNGASIAYQLCSHYRHYTPAYSGRLGIIYIPLLVHLHGNTKVYGMAWG
jgi:hypothetical protein